MKILDVFSGIGGFALASEAAAKELGIESETVCFVEFDKKCQSVLAAAFPAVPVHGDVRTFDPMSFGQFDLLTGGFPCQPFSRNGKFYNKNNRTLGDDDRSNLFLEIVRVLNEAKPKAFLLENVKEILTIKNKDGSLFLDTLMDNLTGCGYDVQYKVLCPTEFGVPQQRKRVFFVGLRSDLNAHFSFPSGDSRKTSVLSIMDDSVDKRFYLNELWKNRKLVKDQSVTRIDALKKSYESDGRGVSEPVGKIHPVAIIYGDTPSGLPRQQDKLYSVHGVSPTIATFSTPAFDHPRGWRILTPKECLRLQSFPDNHPISPSLSDGYKQVGNSVNVRVVTEIMKRIFEALAE